MKSWLLLILVVFTNSILKAQGEEFLSETEYVIMGKVTNAGNHQLLFSKGGTDQSEFTTVEIESGQYHYKLSHTGPEIVYLEIKQYIDLFGTQNRAWIPILLEKDTVVLNLVLSKKIKRKAKEGVYPFDDYDFIRGPQNKTNMKILNDMRKGFDNLIYDSKTLIEYQKTEFPKQRRQMLFIYEKETSGNSNVDDFTKLNLFNEMISNWSFDARFISNSEIQKLNSVFDDLNKEHYINTNLYKRCEDNMMRLNNTEDIVFEEFTLVNYSGEAIKLSEYVNEKKYVVFYFWTSYCEPCRRFNNLIQKNSIIHDLKSKGIEIVHININDNAQEWKRASEEDGIFWDNLYAGKNREIIHAYKIYVYPTKVIFDQNMNWVDFDFRNPEELLNLVE